jgi:hypothetical protein
MTIPRIDPNDPKWTAYVLGELDEADHAAIRRLVEASPEARALVEELRTATIAVDEALATEPALVLTPAQRAALRTAADAQSSRWSGVLRTFRPAQWGLAAGAATAAALAIAVLQLAPGIPTPPVPERAIATGPGVAAMPAPTANPEAGTPNVRARSAAQPPVQSARPLTESAAPVPPQPSAPNAPDAKAEQTASAPVAKPRETITVTGETPVIDVQGSAPLFRAGANALAPAAVPLPSGIVAGRGGIGFAVGDVGPIRGRFPRPSASNESYATVGENTFVRARQEPLATFSIDVDTASYSNVRRFLNQNQLPPADAVRIEELLNYFTYDYPGPTGSQPIGTSMAVTAAPWNPQHRLVRIGVKAREIDARRRPPSTSRRRRRQR